MRYAMLISYDGTEFAGWQRQKNAVSVQEVLENALQTAFQQKISVTASGRTDAGVHAEGQVCHFDAILSIPADKLPEAVNKFLPTGISILQSSEASANFDANRTAKKKTYRYSFYVSKQAIPLKERYALRLDGAPTIEQLQRAALLMNGEKDFKAFCAANSSIKTTIRTIYGTRFTESEILYAGVKIRQIDFYVTGNGFLYNMVRTMAGEILALASGKKTEESLQLAFANGDRKLLDKTLPAKGLTLASVDYGYDLFTQNLNK